MDNQRIARELVAVAKDLTAKAPQMDRGRPSWPDLRSGQRFKYKGKWWIKKSRTKAIEDVKPRTLTVKNNSLEW